MIPFVSVPEMDVLKLLFYITIQNNSFLHLCQYFAKRCGLCRKHIRVMILIRVEKNYVFHVVYSRIRFFNIIIFLMSKS